MDNIDCFRCYGTPCLIIKVGNNRLELPVMQHSEDKQTAEKNVQLSRASIMYTTLNNIFAACAQAINQTHTINIYKHYSRSYYLSMLSIER